MLLFKMPSSLEEFFPPAILEFVKSNLLAQVEFYKSKYAKLHEVVLQTYENEKNLLRKAKDLNEDLRKEKLAAEDIGGRDKEVLQRISTSERTFMSPYLCHEQTAYASDRIACSHQARSGFSDVLFVFIWLYGSKCELYDKNFGNRSITADVSVCLRMCVLILEYMPHIVCAHDWRLHVNFEK